MSHPKRKNWPMSDEERENEKSTLRNLTNVLNPFLTDLPYFIEFHDRLIQKNLMILLFY